MAHSQTKPGPLLGIAITLAAAVIVALNLLGVWRRPASLRPPAKSAPATRATTRAAAPAGPGRLLDLIRQKYPDYTTTQPLGRPVSLSHAGHFVVSEPLFLDRERHLWVTRADGMGQEALAAGLSWPGCIITRFRPVFVHWAMNEKEQRVPYLICRNAAGDGYDLLSAAGRRAIGQGLEYDWSRAFSWDQRIVVPTARGVSVFALDGDIQESASPPLVDGSSPHALVQIAFMNGPLAWVPPSGEQPGSRGVAWCVDGAWTRLGEQDGWPVGILHLIPMRDGSIMQLLADKKGGVRLGVVPLGTLGSDQSRQIAELIGQLSDPDSAKRDQAYQSLTLYGPGLWPLAERAIADEAELPETKARLRDLLRAKSTPLLGGMQLIDGKLDLVCRYADGGALFLAPGGVSIPHGNEEPEKIKPAWLSVQPDMPVRLLQAEMARDLVAGQSQIAPCRGAWVVVNPGKSARLYQHSGDGAALLRKGELEYGRFIGRDREGRYLFKKPAASQTATTQSTGIAGDLAVDDSETLVIDEYLPDPARLPAWELAYPEGSVGWDRNDWPVSKQKGAWALEGASWRPLNENNESMYTRKEDVRRSVPSIRPAGFDGPPLLVTADGTAYFDGKASLTVTKPDGKTVVWALPAAASGDGDSDANLVRAKDGRLYLFNQPGRVLRIGQSSGGLEPFQVEVTFVKKVPNIARPTRVWLDPAGRICIIYNGVNLAILFPDGYIPREIEQLMPAEDQEEN